MNQEELLEEIVKELNSLYFDIKAESIAIELEKKGLYRENILIENKSSFTRPYRRDLLKTRKHHTQTKLFLELSRNGIYDSLPEGFFHKNKDPKGASYGLKRKKKKDEESNSRLFFSPIENELFNQVINIENKERELLDNFYDTDNDFLLKFWELKDYINNRYVIKLLKILPHSHKIAGDLKITQLCLEKILEEKVSITKTFEKVEVNKSEEKILGVSFIAETSKTNVAIPLIEFKIGPIDNEKLHFFYKDKEINEFLELFYSYFLPLEFKIKTQFLSYEKQEFILSEKGAPIMGVSTKI